jgi:hypothetical protein
MCNDVRWVTQLCCQDRILLVKWSSGCPFWRRTVLLSQLSMWLLAMPLSVEWCALLVYLRVHNQFASAELIVDVTAI